MEIRDNPWHAESIQDFTFINCPEAECYFKTKEEPLFQSHAIQNHPRSSEFFDKIEIDGFSFVSQNEF